MQDRSGQPIDIPCPDPPGASAFASAASLALTGSAAAHTAVGCADLPGHVLLEVRGPDAIPFLHNLCTNDLARLPVGHGCEAFFLDLKGRILAYTAVYKGSESVWLDCGPGAADRFRAHLERYAFVSNVEFVDHSTSYVRWHLAGPRAAELLHGAFGCEVPYPQNLCWALPVLGETALLVCRRERAPVEGFDLAVPKTAAETVRARLTSVGRDVGLVDLGADAIETLRIEAGLPVYGRDISDDNFPQEIGRDSLAISLTKGCYLGQETVARIDALGHVNQRLTGVRIDGTSPSAPAPIQDGERTVGRLTSFTFSPRCNATIGLAMVRAELATPGRRLTVAVEPKPLAAEVVSLPFVPTKRQDCAAVDRTVPTSAGNPIT